MEFLLGLGEKLESLHCNKITFFVGYNDLFLNQSEQFEVSNRFCSLAPSLVEGLGLETILSPSGGLPRDPKMQPHPCTHPTPELGRARGTNTGLGWGCCSGEVCRAGSHLGKIVSSSPRAGTQVVIAKSVLHIWLMSEG